jgi:hypothetical protein
MAAVGQQHAIQRPGGEQVPLRTLQQRRTGKLQGDPHHVRRRVAGHDLQIGQPGRVADTADQPVATEEVGDRSRALVTRLGARASRTVPHQFQQPDDADLPGTLVRNLSLRIALPASGRPEVISVKRRVCGEVCVPFRDQFRVKLAMHSGVLQLKFIYLLCEVFYQSHVTKITSYLVTGQT